MGWMHLLCQTYDIVSRQGAFDEPNTPLVPVGFVEKRANICVTLTEEGTFFEATRFAKDEDDKIIMPTTAEAEGRTSGISAFPLCDQLMYVAGDYGSTAKEQAYFQDYLGALQDWAAQPHAPAALKLLCAYLSQRRLIQDMKASGFKVEPAKDAKAFITFRILNATGEEEQLWKRKDVRDSWLQRNARRTGEIPAANEEEKQAQDWELCYVDGQSAPVMVSHPKLLGNGKLISSQDDKTIFQYKGRFIEPNQAVTVSYNASVKAHNTLLWLLKRQGFNRYGMQAVAWATDGMRMTLPVEDRGLKLLDPENEEDDEVKPDTFIKYGEAVRNALTGYKKVSCFNTAQVEKVAVLALQAATPGRISVIYYQELSGAEYANRLAKWYEECSWGFLRFVGPKENRKPFYSISTPTPWEIAEAVLGKRQAETARSDLRNEKSASKVMRELKLRLLHCMVDGAKLPRDMVLSAFHRVTKPLSYTNDNGEWQIYEWNLALSTFCALLHKWQKENNEEVIEVSLEQNMENTDRSFLYGRLLAVVDEAERRALGNDNYRETNAFRYMQLFQQRPVTTWGKLHNLTVPYFAKLGRSAQWYQNDIADISAKFQPGDFDSTAALSEVYLQGFYCQREAYNQRKGYRRTDKKNDELTATEE